MVRILTGNMTTLIMLGHITKLIFAMPFLLLC